MNKAHRDRIAFIRICSGRFEKGMEVEHVQGGRRIKLAPGKKLAFEGIPTFAPELFSLVRQKDTMKRKQFVKGANQIAQEGAIQIFQEISAGMEEIIVGVVGSLQFDVFRYRMENAFIRWIDNEEIDLNKLNLTSDTKKVQDLKGRYLLLFANQWSINWALERNEGLLLSEFSEN